MYKHKEKATLKLHKQKKREEEDLLFNYGLEQSTMCPTNGHHDKIDFLQIFLFNKYYVLRTFQQCKTFHHFVTSQQCIEPI